MSGNNLSIREVQLLELDILKFIHQYCADNGIRYVMCYGTLIGAARHKGFIPWDNDMDIMMPRPDFERLIESFKEGWPSDRYYMLHHSIDDKYHYQCARVCDSYTEIHPDYIREQPSRMGVWVDIFPMDGVPDSIIKRTIREVPLSICKILQRCDIYAVPNQKGLAPLLKRTINRIFPNTGNKYPKKIDMLVKRYPFGETRFVSDEAEFGKTYRGFVEDDFNEPVLMSFEDTMLLAPRNWDTCLREYYGDYMKLPPEEARTTHDVNARWAMNVGR